jgi:hypothetical protein
MGNTIPFPNDDLRIVLSWGFNRTGNDGPYKSKSNNPIRPPLALSSYAKLTATVDLPTPPFFRYGNYYPRVTKSKVRMMRCVIF